MKAVKPMATRTHGAGDRPRASRPRPVIIRGVMTCCDALAAYDQRSNRPAPRPVRVIYHKDLRSVGIVPSGGTGWGPALRRPDGAFGAVSS
jgi:hypothetical protein